MSNCNYCNIIIETSNPVYSGYSGYCCEWCFIHFI